MSYLIRTAKSTDMPSIAALEQRCFDDPWSLAMLEQDNANHWSYFRVLETIPEGPHTPTIVGFCLYWHVVDELHLIQVAIEPTQRRKGLGKKLMLDLLAQGKEKCALRIYLEVRMSNQPARKLYDALHFQPIGVRKKYYHNPVEDAMLMEYAFPVEESS